jgi:AcrR family transcriptional regulator
VAVPRSSGFRGASIAAIAERVSITPSGVLHHFGSKGYFDALVERLAQRSTGSSTISKSAARKVTVNQRKNPSWPRSPQA